MKNKEKQKRGNMKNNLALDLGRKATHIRTSSLGCHQHTVLWVMTSTGAEYLKWKNVIQCLGCL